jgi:hypothetical protein
VALLRCPTKFISGENRIRKDGRAGEMLREGRCCRFAGRTQRLKQHALEMRRHTESGQSQPHRASHRSSHQMPGGLKCQFSAEFWRLLQEASY